MAAFLRGIAAGLLAALAFPAGAASGSPSGAAAVATAHPVATEAAFEVLEAGGNAFDAAVAASAALGVAEPYSSGIGGGGFWLLDPAGGEPVMVDGRETAPSAATATMYQDEEGELREGASMNGPLAAGIPGAPAAWDHIADDYGALSLGRSLEPAIRAAREGFEVTAHYRRMAGLRKEVLGRWSAGAEVFLDDGEVPEEGATIRQPDLADTLQRLAEEGRDGFYRGPVAEALVAGARDADGIWTEDDLADYEVVEREPVTLEHQGWRIHAASLPSSGGITLGETFNILDGYTVEPGSAEGIHLTVEALRRAYRDRNAHLGDPDFVESPAHLLDPAYAAGLRAGIRRDRATPSDALAPVPAAAGGHHTSHLSIVDADGNRVSATLSINYPFGSGFVAPDTGVVLNNEMDDFAAKPGEPNAYGLVQGEANAVAPGKRPLSSMTPVVMEKGDDFAVLGSPGGSRIITQVLLGIRSVQAGDRAGTVVDRPRYHHQYRPDELEYEPGALDEETRKALADRGHELTEEDPWGNMQAVTGGPAGLEAASDSRGEGAAAVRPVP
ncbi:MAG: gamma-glutamyltransferase [Thiohalospira sp.]